MSRPGRQPERLHPDLGSGFRVRDAQSVGVSLGRLRSRDLESPFWGLRTTESIRDLQDRSRLISKRMPADAFFSHVTAGMLHDFPLPLKLQRSTRLDISRPSPHRAPHANSIIGHRLTVSDHDIYEFNGLRVTTPARTWCDLGGVLPLLELVAAGDFVIRRRAPLASVADILDVARSRVSPRGRQKILMALPLLNDRSESPPESMLRVLLEWAGFPRPSVNHEFVGANNRVIARTDLFLEPYQLVLEYQGDYHRTDKLQWRRDMTRRTRLEGEGVRFMEINADDLKNPAELMTRIRKRAESAR
ncbi:MAG TPA: hypothetical protein VHZ81_01290 [Galbitalea sp.]|jgi:hypothetical protein|nr:hypothetical protein [Galbitalea sp.]